MPKHDSEQYVRLKEQHDKLIAEYNDMRRRIIKDVEDALEAISKGGGVSDGAKAMIAQAFKEFRSTPPKKPEELERIETVPKKSKFKQADESSA